MAVVAVVRIKGNVGMPPDIKKTLETLKLTRTFKAALYPHSENLDGMLKKAQRYLTWGKPNKHTVLAILKKAGYPSEDIERFSEKVAKGEAEISSPVFVSLKPPKKGFKRSVKRAYKSKGEYGDRAEDINELIRRMV